MKCVHMVMLSITAAIIGCVGIPAQEMSDARQAIQAAHHVKAKSYVPAAWRKAKQNLMLASQNLEAGQFKQARQIANFAKEQAISAYHMAIAIVRAKKVWQTVAMMGYSIGDGQALLKKAQLAAHQGNVEKTIALAEQAYHQGKSALNLAQLERAKALIDKAKMQQLQPSELTTLNSAEVAYYQQNGKKALELIKNLHRGLGK